MAYSKQFIVLRKARMNEIPNPNVSQLIYILKMSSIEELRIQLIQYNTLSDQALLSSLMAMFKELHRVYIDDDCDKDAHFIAHSDDDEEIPIFFDSRKYARFLIEGDDEEKKITPKIFFEKLTEANELFKDLSRVLDLYMYDVTFGRTFPSQREPNGYFNREMWKPSDYRTPIPFVREDYEEYGCSADDYIQDYYRGRRCSDHLSIYLQVGARLLLYKIENLIFALTDFKAEQHGKNLYEFLL